jgi:stage II sporulation SpoAA-like protein
MPVDFAPAGDNVFRVAFRGVLRKADLDRCETELVAEMQRLGRVRLLFVLDDFGGWAPGDNWRDLTFYARYGDRIERIAIVGEEKWRGEALMFAGAGLRQAPVEFFAGPQASIDDAKVWLTS